MACRPYSRLHGLPRSRAGAAVRKGKALSRSGALALGVLGLGVLACGPLVSVAHAQAQICTSRVSGFMRMPDNQSCTTLGASGKAGFAEGSSSDVPSEGARMGVGPGAATTSLAGSAMANAPVTASPMTSLSTATSSNLPVVDPWKQSR